MVEAHARGGALGGSGGGGETGSEICEGEDAGGWSSGLGGGGSTGGKGGGRGGEGGPWQTLHALHLHRIQLASILLGHQSKHVSYVVSAGKSLLHARGGMLGGRGSGDAGNGVRGGDGSFGGSGGGEGERIRTANSPLEVFIARQPNAAAT